jgi:large subunit ribosomal protein L33
MAKKSQRIIISLECTEARALGKSPSRYSTTKNKQKTPNRMEKMKYNPSLRKHTLHREVK